MAGIVLAAGGGTRLAPLTRQRPKALCPVGGTALVDLAEARVRAVTDLVAVNVHHGREALLAHLGDRVHVSLEDPEPLGTAGAVGALRDWLDGRPAVIVNADGWCDGGLDTLLEGWDGERIRILVPGGGTFGPRSMIAGSLLPGALAQTIEARPAGLFETVWREALTHGTLETVAFPGPFVDCGTPAAYLAANLAASGGQSVVAPEARVAGRVERSVCWEEAVVGPDEVLVDAIRFSERGTVLVR
ncbi:MAG TPA: sugar phosphate nucleotidyltransferase [Acidimicrobiales bacterium]